MPDLIDGTEMRSEILTVDQWVMTPHGVAQVKGLIRLNHQQLVIVRFEEEPDPLPNVVMLFSYPPDELQTLEADDADA